MSRYNCVTGFFSIISSAMKILTFVCAGFFLKENACMFFFLKEEGSDCHSVTSGLPSVTSTTEPEVQQVAGSSTRTSVGPSLSTKTPEVSDFMYGNRKADRRTSVLKDLSKILKLTLCWGRHCLL